MGTTARPSDPSPRGDIVLYRTPDGETAINVRLEQGTVWLAQTQMAELFQKERSVITKHINNVFREKELERESNVQNLHIPNSDKPVTFYNLDVIISVGYRVKSKRGTQFRIWATQVLRDHIVKGYTVNERRLKELNQAIRLIADVAERRELTGDEAASLLRVVADYSLALDLLDDYDHQRVRISDVTHGEVVPLVIHEARRIIVQMRERLDASDLFGREKDAGLEGSLLAGWQTFDGQELYPSLEEKAASLLYFLVKNHHFVDGNKRIAAALLLFFLEKNHALYRPDGTKRIADNALVAMTLLMAESRRQDKDILTSVVVNLINKRNP
jgi:prophage maintenance system killer protein